jgi:hypothetical protein
LKEDLSEKHDMVKEKAEVAAGLLGKLRAWRVSVDAAMPAVNPEWKEGWAPYVPGAAATRPASQPGKKNKGGEAEGARAMLTIDFEEDDD